MVYLIGLNLTLQIREGDIFLNLTDLWSPVASLELDQGICNWMGMTEVEFVLNLFAFLPLKLTQNPIYDKPLMVGWYILSESYQENFPLGVQYLFRKRLWCCCVVLFRVQGGNSSLDYLISAGGKQAVYIIVRGRCSNNCWGSCLGGFGQAHIS